MPMINVTYIRRRAVPAAQRAAHADVHVAVCSAANIEPHGERAFHVWTLMHEIPKRIGPVPERPSTADRSKIWSPTTRRDGVR
jgi:hypothetical protein